MVMGNVKYDLLNNTHRDEGAQTINEWSETRAGQTRSHPNHVLLGNSCVNVLRGACPAEIVKQRVAMIASEQQHIRVGLGQANQRFRKSGPHVAHPATAANAFT